MSSVASKIAVKMPQKDTTTLLNNLRGLMQKQKIAEQPVETISAYIIPSEDEHQSEYICKRDERRGFISGFDGSAGTAVVTQDKALLWTDGRYYQQATKQLDKNWTLMKDGLPTTPTIGNWLAKNLIKKGKVGVDPKLLSYRLWKPIEKELEANDCSLVPIEQNLIDLVWENQPQRPKNSIITLCNSLVGKTIKEKHTDIKKEMKEKNADVLVVSALDEIAWFLNMRGQDINYNPVFFSYLILTQDEINLFIDSSKLPLDFAEHQKANDVHIIVHKYEDIQAKLNELVNKFEGKIWIAQSSSYFLASLVPENKRIHEITPIGIMKAIKNKTEVTGMINCHIRDGKALCQYLAWLEKAIDDGEYVDEISGAAKLEELRSKGKNYMGLSFSTITASGPNGSVIHYSPTKETTRQISKDEIYLVDSGAQYLDGTTDVTRTVHLGEPTEFEKDCYTRVLKGQLTLSATIFPNKIKGQVLDTLARKALWDVGLDYGHGTGHGIGHFLNVHEGPMGIGILLMPDDPGLQENMFLSNEPGYYKDGGFGIRIEDIVQIIPAQVQNNFNGRGALTFKTITMCPKQLKLVKKDLLTTQEISQLNAYHKLVYETLRPILEQENDSLTLAWLERETVAL